MPKMQISRSTLIQKPMTEVMNALNDFHNWPIWSPWLVAEPEAQLDIRADGKYYNWSGKRVGSGEMIVLSESENHISYDLTFLKPWKSKAKTAFDLTQAGSGTKVTWHMDSSLPWFMFWMKKQMQAYIGNDYERGLAMLKEYVEEGKVHSKLDFIGEQAYSGSQYIGLKNDTTVDRMPKDMEEEFTFMMTYMSDKQDITNGKPFTIYHKWDMINQRCSYSSGIPVKSIPSDLPSRMLVGSMPDMKVYTLRHTGKWSHLGNAWSTLYGMQRNKEIKCSKQHPFEVYVNTPADAPSTAMISDICFPLR